MPFEQLKEITHGEKSVQKNEPQSGAVGAIDAIKAQNEILNGDDLIADKTQNYSSDYSAENVLPENSLENDETSLKTLFKSETLVRDEETRFNEDENKTESAGVKSGETSADFDDEYYGFKKALYEMNEELLNESAGKAENMTEKLNANITESKAEETRAKSGDETASQSASDKTNDKTSDKTGDKTSAGDNVVCEKADETKPSGVEYSRYLSEFNEFKYARYMGAVVADMRGVYSAKELAAALNDFEKDKFSAYCVNLRQIKAVKGILDKTKQKQTAEQKRLNGAKASAVIASSYVRKTGDAGGFKGLGGFAKAAENKQKINQPAICVSVGDVSGGNALCLVAREIKYARKNGANEIEVYVSPEAVLAPDHKTLKTEIKTLKRAAGNATLKIGVNLNVLTDLQAETLISVASSLKVGAFVMYGKNAAEKIKRLKSFAPHCRTELISNLKTTAELGEILDLGADRVYTSEFIPLAVCVRRDLEKVEIK